MLAASGTQDLAALWAAGAKSCARHAMLGPAIGGGLSPRFCAQRCMLPMDATQARALIALREAVLRGELPPGAVIDGNSLLTQFGQPLTALEPALERLEREQLIAASADARGYVVRAFTDDEVADAVDVRSALEGLAARRVAERGASAGFFAELEVCLRELDAVLAAERLSTDDKASYAQQNERFHALIVEEAQSVTLSELLIRIASKPFASPGSVAFLGRDPERASELLRYAQRQHYAIVDALVNAQGPRAEILMREHVSPVKDALELRKSRPQSEEPAAPESIVQRKRGGSAATG